MKVIAILFSPFVFGLGFFAPLIAQTMTYFGMSFAGVDNLLFGLVVGGLWGLVVQYRGSWVWARR